MRVGSRWKLLFACMFFAIVQPAPSAIALDRVEIGSLRIVSPDGQETVISEDELLGLPQSQITTSTAWTEGTHLFEGISLGKILESAGINPRDHPDATIRAIAINDYEVDFPLADIARYDVLIAAFMDGERLSVSDKGPYWVVYPRDDFYELRDSRFDHRWAWQLQELQIR